MSVAFVESACLSSSLFMARYRLVDRTTADPDAITLQQDFNTFNRGSSPDLFDGLGGDVPRRTVTIQQDSNTFNRGTSPELFDYLDGDVPRRTVTMFANDDTQDRGSAPLFSSEQQAWLESWLASRSGGAESSGGSSQPPPHSGKYTYVKGEVVVQVDLQSVVAISPPASPG